MARLVVTARLPDPTCVERLREAGHDVLARDDPEPAPAEELLRLTEGRDGMLCLVGDRVDAAFMDARPSVRWVANFGVGVDNVDLPAAAARGVRVANTPGVLTEAVADHALALILATLRRVAEGDRMVRGGSWTGFQTDLLLGRDLAGSVVGLVGLGSIGMAIARRLVHGFGVTALYTRRGEGGAAEREMGLRRASLDDLLRHADVVCVQVPLTHATRGMIGARELALMRDGAVIVNIARGPVIDEEALVAELRTGRISAGLDVYAAEPIGADHPLCALPNVVLTPHIASASVASRSAMGHLAVDNLLAMAAGREPPAPVTAG